MANISKIRDDSTGVTYDIEDSVARASIANVFGWTNEQRISLMAVLRAGLFYNTPEIDTLLDNLETSLYSHGTLESLSATYTASGTVYANDGLDSLKKDLVVTATWEDGTIQNVISYTLSGELNVGSNTITVSYLGQTDTFTVVAANPLLYNWDFTLSLTDTVSGIVATPSNCTTDSSGVSFTGDTSYIEMGNVFGKNRTLEIDISGASAAFGNVNGILFELVSVEQTGGRSAFGYHHSGTPANAKFGLISYDVAHWAYASNYGKTSFNGSYTLKMHIADDGTVTIYKGGTNINVLYDGAAPYCTTEELLRYLIVGSKTYYPAFYTATITGVRVYHGAR